MKSKILSYAGPHKAVVEGGKLVKLAVNVAHPKPGESLEFEEGQIVGKVDELKVEGGDLASKKVKELLEIVEDLRKQGKTVEVDANAKKDDIIAAINLATGK